MTSYIYFIACCFWLFCGLSNLQDIVFSSLTSTIRGIGSPQFYEWENECKLPTDLYVGVKTCLIQKEMTQHAHPQKQE